MYVYCTFTNGGMDGKLQHLFYRTVQSADSRGVESLHQIGHLFFGGSVCDGMIPGVRHAHPVYTEHTCGQSIQLTRTSLDVVFSVVLEFKKDILM